ncbi:hypothetical protein ACFOD9_02830 [Novosphingobium bradum]|uniref:Lipoprotein n=1 Tax=Novosphingobium bradum TaxID=1737444 RepID=A0ABV7IQR1_9SPHN
MNWPDPASSPAETRRRAQRIARRAGTLALGCALLAGCATNGQYPSLAKGPSELASEGRIRGCGNMAAPPVPVATVPVAPAPAPAPADLTGRLVEITAEARAAHESFASQRARVAGLAGAGAARGSDGWAVAQVALAELSSARSSTALALTELDRLYVAQRVDGGDGQAIAAVRDQVTAWVADEDAVLAGLVGRLGN